MTCLVVLNFQGKNIPSRELTYPTDVEEENIGTSSSELPLKGILCSFPGGVYIHIYIYMYCNSSSNATSRYAKALEKRIPVKKKKLSESKDEKNKPLVPVEPVDTDHNLKVQGPGGNRNRGSEMFHGLVTGGLGALALGSQGFLGEVFVIG